jgi:hypothetical protein
MVWQTPQTCSIDCGSANNSYFLNAAAIPPTVLCSDGIAVPITTLPSQFVCSCSASTICSAGILPSNSCATDPAYANIGTLTPGTPTSVGQAWSYNAAGTGPCTYICTNGYSGDSCATPPAPVISFSRTCNGINCTTVNPGDTQTVSWSILYANSVSWICDIAPNTTTQTATSYHAPEISTYDSLISFGWTPGYHHCTMTAIGAGGTTNQDISVTIGTPSTYTCASNPTFANIGTLTSGTPTYNGYAWTYNTAGTGPCTYTCINGYSGDSCATAPVVTLNSCTTTPTFANIGTTFIGTPISVEQSWTYNTSGTGPCTYTCINGYSGDSCATAPTYTCATDPGG